MSPHKVPNLFPYSLTQCNPFGRSKDYYYYNYVMCWVTIDLYPCVTVSSDRTLCKKLVSSHTINNNMVKLFHRSIRLRSFLDLIVKKYDINKSQKCTPFWHKMFKIASFSGAPPQTPLGELATLPQTP